MQPSVRSIVWKIVPFKRYLYKEKMRKYTPNPLNRHVSNVDSKKKYAELKKYFHIKQLCVLFDVPYSTLRLLNSKHRKKVFMRTKLTIDLMYKFVQEMKEMAKEYRICTSALLKERKNGKKNKKKKTER